MHRQLARACVSLALGAALACSAEPPAEPSALQEGRRLLARGQPVEAVAPLREAARSAPDDPNALAALGRALVGAGALDAGAATLERALALDEEHPETHLGLGDARVRQSRFDEALAHFRRAVELVPNDAQIRSVYASALERGDRLEEAIEQYRRALALDASPTARARLARAEQLPVLQRAVEEREAALLASPEDPGLQFSLAEAQLARGRTGAAIAIFERLLRRNPEHAAAHAGIGAALVAQRRQPRALLHLAEALRIDPDSKTAAERVAWVLAVSDDDSLRDPEAAVAMALRGSERWPGDPTWLDTLAAAHAAAGRFELAAATAERAIDAARSRGDRAHAARIEARMQTYREHRAIREGAPPGARLL